MGTLLKQFMAGVGGGRSWSSFWETLISATVENAAPTHVVLTFPTAKTELGASDFTIAGFTIDSASWTGSVLTLVLSSAVTIFNGNLTITFVTTGQTATVTNNVLTYWETLIAFKSGSFDFSTNKWLDQSGNGNDVILKGASARTGNGSDLDYTVAGLLTSDTIEVVSGSDTPTIPSDGVLRIGATQTVYGVTIKRSGDIWAVIPFCEPTVYLNLPTRSFDVSGNGHHAICSTIAAGNVTTQDNYFYLLQHGYSLGSEDKLQWDLSSWTGSVETYTAIFSGVTLDAAQTEDKYIQPTPDGLGCRVTRNAGFTIKFRKFLAMTIGLNYRLRIRIENFSATANSSGFQSPNLGIAAGNYNWIVNNGTFDYRKSSLGTTFELGPSNTVGSSVLDFYDVKLQLLEIVPALIDGTADAIGNPIEFIQDNSTLLRYAAAIQLPTSMISADQKGCWSDYINQGLCVAGKTYYVEKCETDHFGVGVVAGNEFVATGTESCNDDNEVRELIHNGTERGLFFDDDNTPHPRWYDDILAKRTHFCYCDKPAVAHYHQYYYPNPDNPPAALYDAPGYGWKEYRYSETIKNLVILGETVFLTDEEKALVNAMFDMPEAPTFGMINIQFDSIEDDEVAAIATLFETKNVRLTRALYFSDTISYEDHESILTSKGHETIMHTPGFGTYLPEYKNFHDTAANYTEEQLRTYYAAVKAFAESYNYFSNVKILPGGQADALTRKVAPDYFKYALQAVSSETINRYPLENQCIIGRDANDYVDAAAVTYAQGKIDAIIAVKGWSVVYSHNYSWSASSLANLELVLDYLASKTAAGEPIRMVKMRDAYNIINNIK